MEIRTVTLFSTPDEISDRSETWITILYFRLIKIHPAREKMILFLYIGHFLLIPLTNIHEILSRDESISERTSRRLLLLLSVKFLLLRWLIDLIVFIVHMHKSSGDLSDALRTLAPFLLTVVRAKFRVRYVQMMFRSDDCYAHQPIDSKRMLRVYWLEYGKTGWWIYAPLQ